MQENRMNRHAIVCLIMALLLVAFHSHTFAAGFNGTFEDGIKEWKFSNGGEYKGAKGNLSLSSIAPHQGGNALELSADFSGGGRYVSAWRKFDPQVETESVSFWIKTQQVTKVLVQFYDQTDQCFQHELIVPRGTEWKQITVDKLASRLKWGGAKDGRWHGKLSKIDIAGETENRRRRGYRLFAY